ncbi:MAG: hypothetical protein AB1894_15725 [Chloroflexota bacterium]
MHMHIYQAPQPKSLLSRRAFFDTFTDADATVITDHTPNRPAGCTWNAGTAAPHFTIQSNRLVGYCPGLKWCTPTGWHSPNLYARLQCMNGEHAPTSTAHYMLLGWKLSAPNLPLDGWTLQWATKTNADGVAHMLRLRKFVAGTPTEIDLAELTGMTYNYTGVLRLLVSGNYFKFSIDHNPAWTIEYTDTANWNVDQGYFLLGHASYNVVPTTDWWFDNLFLLRL